MCITAKVLQLGVPLVTAAHVTRVVVLITTTGRAFASRGRCGRGFDGANIVFRQFYSAIRLNGPSAATGDRVLEFTTHSTLRASRPSLRWAVCLSGVSKR